MLTFRCAMNNGPHLLIQNVGIPNFRPWKTLLSLANAMFLLFRCPSLLGSVYTPTFLPHLRLCSTAVCEFGTDRALNMEALLRKNDAKASSSCACPAKIGGVPCRENL